ncbi:hypothetical protein APHAL10511_003092 [Amanita phalloides]|nr:hypothetical protein APHAL10511_003092 [Amanita phalloides]
MAVGATRPHKRLRTSASPSAASSIEPSPLRTGVTPSKSPGPLSCKSCHRLLTVIQGQLLFCSRCSAPTCTICSRTCTARAPSQPPTPHLTWSPSPSPPQSPYQPDPDPGAVADPPYVIPKTSQVMGKRRKASDDDLVEQISKSDCSDEDYGIGPGCGRTVCRDCCIENIQSNTISCYDCYGH